MALQPSLSPLLIGNPVSPHTVEVFIDYSCTFSTKIFLNGLDKVVKPFVTKGGKYDGKVKLILRVYPQPWHYAAPFTAEAALAVARVKPDLFWAYSLAVFKEQNFFSTKNVSDYTPTQLRERLVQIAEEVGLDKAEAEQVAILINNKRNANQLVGVLDDVKYGIKIGRQNSIHVTPTVLWDGLIANEVSSSWGEAEWSKYLGEKVHLN